MKTETRAAIEALLDRLGGHLEDADDWGIVRDRMRDVRAALDTEPTDVDIPSPAEMHDECGRRYEGAERAAYERGVLDERGRTKERAREVATRLRFYADRSKHVPLHIAKDLAGTLEEVLSAARGGDVPAGENAFGRAIRTMYTPTPEPAAERGEVTLLDVERILTAANWAAWEMRRGRPAVGELIKLRDAARALSAPSPPAGQAPASEDIGAQAERWAKQHHDSMRSVFGGIILAWADFGPETREKATAAMRPLVREARDMARAEGERAYLDGRKAADEAIDKIRAELGHLYPGKGPYPMLEAARAEIERLRATPAPLTEAVARFLAPILAAQRTPWPIYSVLVKLADAADVLLDFYSCDLLGYETVMGARDSARAIVAATGRAPEDFTDRFGADTRSRAALGSKLGVRASGLTEAAEMGESESYGWAAQALRPIQQNGADAHRYQQVLDLVASAVREAWAHRRAKNAAPEPAAERGGPIYIEPGQPGCDRGPEPGEPVRLPDGRVVPYVDEPDPLERARAISAPTRPGAETLGTYGQEANDAVRSDKSSKGSSGPETRGAGARLQVRADDSGERVPHPQASLPGVARVGEGERGRHETEGGSVDASTRPDRQATIAAAIETGVKALTGEPFRMRGPFARDVAATVVVATLDTVVDAVPGLAATRPAEDIADRNIRKGFLRATAELAEARREIDRLRATPAPLTDAEARAWAERMIRDWRINEGVLADLLLAASRGDIPPEVRATAQRMPCVGGCGPLRWDDAANAPECGVCGIPKTIDEWDTRRPDVSVLSPEDVERYRHRPGPRQAVPLDMLTPAEPAEISAGAPGQIGPGQTPIGQQMVPHESVTPGPDLCEPRILREPAVAAAVERVTKGGS